MGANVDERPVQEWSAAATEGADTDGSPAPEVEVVDAPPAEQGHVETERKFDVPRRWTLPKLEGVGAVAKVEASRRFTQTATYLDTLDLDLLHAKHTLRRRVGGHDAGWHLKKPLPDGSRLELAQPLTSSAVRVPPGLRSELADIAGQKPLLPVAALRTVRTERRLLDADGKQLAVIADDTVEATVYLFGERIYRWREIEVELVDGEPAVLDELATALAGAGLRASTSQSKLARALADAVERLERRDDNTAGAVVLRYLGTQVGVLQWLEAAVREDSPDAVHKSRVATRRLRSALRSFRRLVDRTVTDPLRAEIRWLTGVLGAPRDAEVLRRRFQKLAATLDSEQLVGTSVQRLENHLEDEHKRAHARLVTTLDSRRYERLLAALTDLLVHPPWQPEAMEPAAEQLPRLVRKSAKAVGRTVVAVEEAEDPEVREEAFHDLRKRIKAARYAAEATSDIITKADERTAEWTALQDTLGDYQDSIVARGVISGVSTKARAASEDTFTLGVLSEREAAQARAVRDESETLLATARACAARKVRARKT